MGGKKLRANLNNNICMEASHRWAEDEMVFLHTSSNQVWVLQITEKKKKINSMFSYHQGTLSVTAWHQWHWRLCWCWKRHSCHQLASLFPGIELHWSTSACSPKKRKKRSKIQFESLLVWTGFFVCKKMIYRYRFWKSSYWLP